MIIKLKDGEIAWNGKDWETEADAGTDAVIAMRLLNINHPGSIGHALPLIVAQAQEVAQTFNGELVDAPCADYDPSVIY